MLFDKQSFNIIVLGKVNCGKTTLIRKLSNLISRDIIIDDSDTSSICSRKTMTFESVFVEDNSNVYKFIDSPGYNDRNGKEWIEDIIEFIKDKVMYAYFSITIMIM